MLTQCIALDKTESGRREVNRLKLTKNCQQVDAGKHYKKRDSHLSANQSKLVYGDVWHDMLKLPTLRNGPQYLSSVLTKLSCRVDGGGRVKTGRSHSVLFDREKVLNQIRFGGLAETMRRYYDQRANGQRVLFALPVPDASGKAIVTA
jgi:hypothetical protein